MLLQSAAFGGVFTGFGIARDFEYGFTKRLLLAAPHRSAIIVGYALAAFTRWVVTAAVVTTAAFILGMNVTGNGIDMFGLYLLAAIVNCTAVLWATGVAARLRTIQAGPAMQMPVFLALFLAPVYVPLTLLTGWIHGVARLNPVTYFLEAGPWLHLRRRGVRRGRIRCRALPGRAVRDLGGSGLPSRRSRRRRLAASAGR